MLKESQRTLVFPAFDTMAQDDLEATQFFQAIDIATQTAEIIKHSKENRIWSGVDRKTYGTLLDDSIFELSKIMPDADEEKVTNMCRLSLALANDIYDFAVEGVGESQNTFERTHYHGMAKPQEGAVSHIEMVMANSVVAFLTLKRAAKSPDTLTQEELGYFNEYYGSDWQKTIDSLDADDLKQVVGYAAFHEVGEWWPRTVPPEKLEQYKEKATDAINYYFSGSRQNSKVYITDWTTKRGDPNMWKEAKEDHSPRGTGWVNGEWQETAFDVKLHAKAHERDTNFGIQLEMNPDKRPLRGSDSDEDKKLVAKSRIVRAADLMQAFDQNYGEMIPMGEERVMKGPAILYQEMEAFMPHALKSYGWAKITDAGVSPFFLNTIVLKYNCPRPLLGLIDKSGITGSEDYYRRQIRYLESNMQIPATAA